MDTATLQKPKDTLLAKSLFDIKSLLAHLVKDVDHSIELNNQGISTEFAAHIEDSLKDPFTSLIHFNSAIKDQILDIVNLKIKQHFIEHQKDIKCAGRVKSTELVYVIQLKKDTIKKQAKIDQIVFDFEKLKLPFDIIFQFVNTDDKYIKFNIIEPVI